MFSEDEFSPPTTPLLSKGKGVAGVGLSNPQLSQGRRRMLDLVNRLHSTGLVGCFFFCSLLFSFLLIDQCRVQVDIDIPQIAVIGQQSAGKSSLIEAISGITLPRSAGTCTRYVSPICTLVYPWNMNKHKNDIVVQQNVASCVRNHLGNVSSPSDSPPTQRGSH